MIFQFSEPFRAKFGNTFQIDLKNPISLRKLIKQLPADFLETADTAVQAKDDLVLAQIHFFREGRSIRLDDLINERDTILVMLPAFGG